MTCASCGSSRESGSAPAQYEAIADLYDGYPGNYLDDVVFYAEEARRAGASVLELGVGSGRLAFCLAAVGVDVLGLDSSPAMLRGLARRRRELPGTAGRVRVLASDMRCFCLRRRFPLAIIAFRTFLYMLTSVDQLRALRCIRRHLAPGGRLIMSFFVPPPALIAEGRTERQEAARFPAPEGAGEVVAFDWTEFVPARQHVISHITYEWREEDGRTSRRLEHELVMRYLFPSEVTPLLRRAGYRVVETYGGFDRSPLTATSREQIWIAEPVRRQERQA
jgi:SAM-dependent methyltransferase